MGFGIVIWVMIDRYEANHVASFSINIAALCESHIFQAYKYFSVLTCLIFWTGLQQVRRKIKSNFEGNTELDKNIYEL